MNSLVVVLDTTGNIIMLNKLGLEILGFKEEEIIGKNWFNIGVLPSNQYQVIKEYFNNVMLRKINLTNDVFENELNDKNGNKLVFNWSNSLIVEGDEVKGVVSAGNNITKEKRQSEIINEQAKLASMGEMIGNIAHQWRQPLSIITTSASGMNMQNDYNKLKKEDISKFSDLIIQQAEYLSITIDNFRDFAKNETSYNLININHVLQKTFSLVQATLENSYIQLISKIDDDLSINGNINELSQAFINIINNAKDILKENIKLDDERFIFVTTKLISKKRIEITIKDNAGGVPKEIINHIFEPYFTTKHKSQGTGLGLSMVYKIISKRHKGEITVNNEVFEYNNKQYTGACFKIIFDTTKTSKTE